MDKTGAVNTEKGIPFLESQQTSLSLRVEVGQTKLIKEIFPTQNMMAFC